MAPHPTLRQSEQGIASMLKQLRTFDDLPDKAGLTKAEKLMVTNLAPTTDVELYAVSQTRYTPKVTLPGTNSHLGFRRL